MTPRRLIPLLSLLALLSPTLPAEEQPRTWTNREGKTITARFVEFDGDKAVLELENGSRSSVPVTALSLEDQEHLRILRDKEPLVWPDTLAVNEDSVTVTEGEQNPETREYHYKTKTFRFISNAPLTNRVMTEVAADFELVSAAIRAMPWGWEPRPETGERFKMHLAETEEDFIALGGVDNSSGGSKDDYAFVKFSAMGLRKLGSQYSYDASEKEPGRVVSLGARLLMDEMRSMLRPWSSSGMETFLRDVAYHKGEFQFDGLETTIKRIIREDTDRGRTTLEALRKFVWCSKRLWNWAR